MQFKHYKWKNYIYLLLHSKQNNIIWFKFKVCNDFIAKQSNKNFKNL